jgi:hypothetical protein
MITEKELEMLLPVTKELIRASEQILDTNSYQIRFGNYEFTQAIRNAVKTVEQIEHANRTEGVG